MIMNFLFYSALFSVGLPGFVFVHTRHINLVMNIISLAGDLCFDNEE